MYEIIDNIIIGVAGIALVYTVAFLYRFVKGLIFSKKTKAEKKSKSTKKKYYLAITISVILIIISMVYYQYYYHSDQDLILNETGLLISKKTKKPFTGEFRRDLNGFNGRINFKDCCDSIIGYSEDGVLNNKTYFKSYYLSDEIESEIPVKNNFIFNPDFWPNRNSNDNYFDLNITGKASTYYINGKLKSQTNYKDSKRDGRSIEWFDNGQKKSQTDYRDSKRDGNAREWFDNGSVKSSKIYNEDKKVLSSIYGHKNGEKRSQVWYKELTRLDKDQEYPTIVRGDVYYDNGIRKIRYRKDESTPYRCWNNLGNRIDCSNIGDLRLEFD